MKVHSIIIAGLLVCMSMFSLSAQESTNKMTNVKLSSKQTENKTKVAKSTVENTKRISSKTQKTQVVDAKTFIGAKTAQTSQRTEAKKTDTKIVPSASKKSVSKKSEIVSSESLPATPKQVSTVTVTDTKSVKPRADYSNLLRTKKKIVPTDNLTAPYYTIQVLALRYAPQDPDFFWKIDAAREVACKDGFKHYFVGQYGDELEALPDLNKIKALGTKYKDAFIVNTQLLEIANSEFVSDYTRVLHPIINDEKDSVKFDARYGDKQDLKVVPEGTYIIQLSASRYPFYVSEIKEYKDVLEFHMPDKVFRYTTGKIAGSLVEEELKKAKDFGYKDAFIVDWNVYAPYQIE